MEDCFGKSNHQVIPPTAWQPGGAMSNEIREQEGIHTNDQFRQFLQSNADKIVSINQHLAANQCCECNVYYTKDSITPNNPFMFTNVYDNAHPFGYQSSDLKEYYISKLRDDHNMYVPVVTQKQIQSVLK